MSEARRKVILLWKKINKVNVKVDFSLLFDVFDTIFGKFETHKFRQY